MQTRTIITIAITLLLAAALATAAAAAPAQPASPATATAALTSATPTQEVPVVDEIIANALQRINAYPSYKVDFSIVQNKLHAKFPKEKILSHRNRYTLTVRCEKKKKMEKDCALRLDAVRGVLQKTKITYLPAGKSGKVVIRHPGSTVRVSPDDVRATDFFRTPIHFAIAELKEEMNSTYEVKPRSKGGPLSFLTAFFSPPVKTEKIKVMKPKTVSSRTENGYRISSTRPGWRTLAYFDEEYQLLRIRVDYCGSVDNCVLDTLQEWKNFKPMTNLPDETFQTGRK